MQTLQALTYIAGMTKQADPLGTMPQELWSPTKDSKPDHVIQLNCGEVCTNASYKTTRPWKNNQGTKILLLSNYDSQLITLSDL